MDLRVVPITYIDNHHTAGHEANTEAVRRYHMDVLGWGDIGYNSVIEMNGIVGKGRDVKWAGAHDPGTVPGEKYSMNQVAYAISSIGNFQSPNADNMTEIQFQSLLKENFRIMMLYNVPIERVRKHRDQYATACPGDNFPWDRLIAGLKALSAPAPVKATQYMLVTANPSLNVRSGAGTDHPVIGSILKGERVKIGFIKDGWANIYFGQHGGFVSAQYLK